MNFSSWLTRLRGRLDLYEKLMRLDKPIGILLLLWPTLWGLWFSSLGQPSWIIVWIFLLGTVLMRSAGCVINDLADRKFDAHVARTSQRPLVTGAVSVGEAIGLFVVLVACASVLLLPIRSNLLIGLALTAFFLAATYPLTKRFFAVPQAYLGVAFGFGIPMAYAAQIGSVLEEAWWLLLANVFWAIAYDTEYAMVDREDDLKIGIKTSAITFGRYDVLAVMLCYAATLGVFAWIGHQLRMGGWFYGGLAIAAIIAAYHFTLIRQRDPAGCFKAFRHNNWFGASIFAGIVFDFFYTAKFY